MVSAAQACFFALHCLLGAAVFVRTSDDTAAQLPVQEWEWVGIGGSGSVGVGVGVGRDLTETKLGRRLCWEWGGAYRDDTYRDDARSGTGSIQRRVFSFFGMSRPKLENVPRLENWPLEIMVFL